MRCSQLLGKCSGVSEVKLSGSTLRKPQSWKCCAGDPFFRLKRSPCCTASPFQHCPPGVPGTKAPITQNWKARCSTPQNKWKHGSQPTRLLFGCSANTSLSTHRKIILLNADQPADK